jgi:hypothetical protein
METPMSTSQQIRQPSPTLSKSLAVTGTDTTRW